MAAGVKNSPAGEVAAEAAAAPPGRPAHFQPEIQALRALAVVAVITYHFLPAALPGGYIGVDIFFVISGYLITGLMIREITSTGRLSFRKFYGRRIRRILPAASAALLTITLLGVLLLPLNHWRGLGREALATTFFGQNWYLANESVDYLAAGGVTSPLQHYWSLSVEEQFYFIWPALLVAAIAVTAWLRRRSGRPAPSPRVITGVVLWAVVLVSGVYSVIEVSAGNPAAYFVTPARAWELALGGLLAVHWPQLSAPRRIPARLYGIGWFVSGAFVLGYALIAFDADTQFPGLAALAPTAGTAAVIIGAHQLQGTRVGTTLGARSIQWCGDASYSLYLWHWPVVIFLPYLVADVTLPVLLVGIGAAFLLGGLSRQLIEVPFLQHTSSTTSLRRLSMVAAASMSVTALVGAGTVGWFQHTNGELESAAEEIESDPPEDFGSDSIRSEEYQPFVSEAGGIAPAPADARRDLPAGATGDCKSAIGDDTTPRCEYGEEDADTTVVLLGDSHIEQYLPAFAEIAESESLRIITYFHASCPFTLGQRESDADRGGPCLSANEDTLAEVIDADEADLFITSNLTDHPFVTDGDVPSPEEGFQQVWQDLSSTAPVAVLSDNPKMLPEDETTECVLDNLDDPEACARDRDEALPTDRQRAAAEDDSDVSFIDMTDQFCTQDECPPVIGNVMVYRDEQHLTDTYATTMADDLWGELEPLL